MDVTVFYAWQDDRPGKCNRYLIHDAAEAACGRITEDTSNDFTLHLDQDTAGRPGMCDIPNTILEKIRECDILLADLTFVGRTDPETKHNKQISNPNVLMELGYSVGCKVTEGSDGFDRVIGVMNTAFGKPEDQMFDIKRRRPICYELPEQPSGEEPRRVERSLSKDIENALLEIVKGRVPPTKGAAGSQRFQQIRDEFESSLRQRSFHDLYINSNVIAVTLAPNTPLHAEHETLRQCQLKTIGRNGSLQPRARRIISVDEGEDPSKQNGSRLRCAVADLDDEGTIRSADLWLLHPKFHREAYERLGDIIETVAFEKTLIEAVLDYGHILKGLDAPLPWRMGVSLLGIKGFRLFFRNGVCSRESYTDDDLVTDAILIQSHEAIETPQDMAHLLKASFDFIWQEFGFEGSRNYDRHGDWGRYAR